jgi:hypothetical protein
MVSDGEYALNFSNFHPPPGRGPFQSLNENTLIAQYFEGDTNINGADTAREFTEIVKQAIDNRTTYPLFDDTTETLVKTEIENNRLFLSRPKTRQAKHSALVRVLLERLPDFSYIPIDQLIDIREEIRNPLKKFRSGVSAYARKIESAPWDKEFEVEVNEVLIELFEPSLLEREDIVKSRSGPLPR